MPPTEYLKEVINTVALSVFKLLLLSLFQAMQHPFVLNCLPIYHLPFFSKDVDKSCKQANDLDL